MNYIHLFSILCIDILSIILRYTMWSSKDEVFSGETMSYEEREKFKIAKQQMEAELRKEELDKIKAEQPVAKSIFAQKMEADRLAELKKKQAPLHENDKKSTKAKKKNSAMLLSSLPHNKAKAQKREIKQIKGNGPHGAKNVVLEPPNELPGSDTRSQSPSMNSKSSKPKEEYKIIEVSYKKNPWKDSMQGQRFYLGEFIFYTSIYPFPPPL